jgi:hypothetical protein
VKALWSLATLLLLAMPGAHAQDAAPGPEPDPTQAASDGGVTSADRFWVSWQANFITQYHPAFSALYSGTNSLPTAAQDATSRVLTLYTGVRLTRYTDLLIDFEEAGGNGIGAALGLAGFTNLDVVRNPTLSKVPYFARAMIHQVIPLSAKHQEVERSWLSLAPALPERRIELRAGKLSTDDFFDVNDIGSDSHLQFLNWTADTNGAYDYAADTRGYTYGILAEYDAPLWSFRFGEMLMPTVANGIKLDWDLKRARSDNYELELRPRLVKRHATVIRLLGFSNHADMGSYREAVERWREGLDPVPDIIATRRQGRLKSGFGVNLQQQLTPDLRAYGRFGWNDGHNESFAYTEVDQSISGGVDLRGTRWHRAKDKLGVALLVNAISGDHRVYLADGGLGFLLGDGALRYAREQIIESYYNVYAGHGVSLAPDIQRVWNPGYNQDRGPLWVASFRLHIDGDVAFARR